MKKFVVKAYFGEEQKKSFSYTNYFLAVFYRSLLPIFCFFMTLIFWNNMIMRILLLAFLLFFVLGQFEVELK